MIFLKSLYLIILSLGLMACSTLPNAEKLPVFPLFDPADLGQNINITQVVANKADNKSQVMLIAWSVNNGIMDLIGLTITGQKILHLNYDGKNLVEEYSQFLKAPINGRTVVSQIQFSYWPLDKIQQQLTGSPWMLVQNQQQREITFKGNTVTTIKAKVGEVEPEQFNQVWPELLLESPVLEQKLAIKTISLDKIQ
jgi:hypothetical protein